MIIQAAIEVKLTDNMEVDKALRLLRRTADRNCVQREFRRKENRIKPAEQRKRDKVAAKKRLKKRKEKLAMIRESQKLSARILLAKQKKANNGIGNRFRKMRRA